MQIFERTLCSYLSKLKRKKLQFFFFYLKIPRFTKKKKRAIKMNPLPKKEKTHHIIGKL